MRWFIYLLLLALSAPASAQFALTRHVFGGGGGQAANQPLTLSGTIGQPVAGPTDGSGFTLSAGYWSASGLALAAPSTITVGIPANARPQDTIVLQIQAGSTAQPVDDLHSVTLTIVYDTKRVSYKTGSFAVGSFFDPTGTVSSASAPVVDRTNGRVTLSFSRTVASGVTGSGPVALLSFTVVDQAAPGPLSFPLTNLQGVDDGGGQIPLTQVASTGQILGVWPGDANQDCVVDISDFFPVLTSWGHTGTARPGAPDHSWKAHAYTPWTVVAETYLDVDGDGTIGIQDLLGMIVNFGDTRRGLPGSECTAPKTAGSRSTPITIPQLAVGDSVLIQLSSDVVVNDLLGAAIELTIPTDLFSVRRTAAGSLIDNGDVAGIEHFADDTGLLSAAYGRKGPAARATGTGGLIYVVLDVVGEMGGPTQIELGLAALGNASGEVNLEAPIVTQAEQTFGTPNEATPGLPETFRLDGAYPNPFNPTTTVVFDLPMAADVSVILYDALGRQVGHVRGGPMSAGHARTVRLDATGLPSGMYLYRLVARGSRTEFGVGRVLFVK